MSKKKIVFSLGETTKLIFDPGNPVTICTLTQKEMIVSFGISRRQGCDEWDLKTACKQALASCIRRGVNNKTLRKYLWKVFMEYFPERKKAPNPQKPTWVYKTAPPYP